jgi:hypothetical protein
VSLVDEVSLAEGLDETLISTFPLEEDEVVQSCEEVINSDDAVEFMEKPPDIVDDHIDDFIHIGRCGWDLGHVIFYKDPIYDIEGISPINNCELSPSMSWFSYWDDPGIWHA